MTRTRVEMGAAVLLVVALVAAVISWSRNGSCTSLDCVDGVAYSIPDEAYVAWGAAPDEPVIVETCIDDECQTAEVAVDSNGKPQGTSGGVLLERGTLDRGRVHTVSLKVTDPSGMVRYNRTDSGATLMKSQPNGPDCGPTCAAWNLALEPEDLGL